VVSMSILPAADIHVQRLPESPAGRAFAVSAMLPLSKKIEFTHFPLATIGCSRDSS